MEVLSKEEIDKLLQGVAPSEIKDVYDDEVDPCDAAFIDGLLNSMKFAEETVPTMAQSMGIKFDKTPSYDEVRDKVNSSFGIKPEPTKRGKLSKMRKGFDATKGRKGRKALSEAEVDQLLKDLTSSEIDETIPTMAQSMGIKFDKTPTYAEVVNTVKAQSIQPDREM